MGKSNKEIIRAVNAGFMEDDVEGILQHIADDIRWEVKGAFTAIGRDEFKKAIHHEDFEPCPTIITLHETAEGDFVAVEGTVKSKMKNGALFEAYFHNLYRLVNGKIKEMNSYVVPK
jgi:ketosteroid isomerase-like protein